MSDGVEMRAMHEGDLPAVSSIYASHVGAPLPESFSARIRRLFDEPQTSVALVAEADGRVVGYVVAEVRSWEFGSAPAGWVFGVSVSRDHAGKGVARALLGSAVRRLRDLGAEGLRTMVANDDVAMLRLFRSAGFVAGPYTQLELTPEEET